MQPLIQTDYREPYNMPRQALPEVYWQTGYVDAAWTDTILDKNSMTGERILPLVIDPSEWIDIDSPDDWRRAERLLESGEITFDDLGFRSGGLERITWHSRRSSLESNNACNQDRRSPGWRRSADLYHCRNRRQPQRFPGPGLKLIDVAVDAGADAVKFQKRNLDKLYAKKYLDNANAGEKTLRYLLPILQQVELTDERLLPDRRVLPARKASPSCARPLTPKAPISWIRWACRPTKWPRPT